MGLGSKNVANVPQQNGNDPALKAVGMNDENMGSKIHKQYFSTTQNIRMQRESLCEGLQEFKGRKAAALMSQLVRKLLR